MDVKKFQSLLSENFDDYIFTIYPFITNVINDNDNLFVGSIIAPEKKWTSLMKLLSKSKYVTYTTKIYIFKDLEYNLIDQNKDFVVHKKIFDAKILDDSLLIISKHDILDIDSFPKLNVYHDEFEKISKIYKFGTISLNLITVKKNDQHDKSYIEILFQYKKGTSDKILKDLNYVNDNILNK